MTKTSDPNPPRSILFVCVGNTCRSPMAAALARRRWPQYRVASAGTIVLQEGGPAAQEAVDVMASFGIDISGHQAHSVSSMDVQAFQIVVPMSKKVRRTMIDIYAVPEQTIRNMFIDDPIGSDVGEYLTCANEIARGVNRLSL